MKNAKSMGARLKELRTRDGLKVDDLSTKLGLTKSVLWSYELNKKEPSISHLIKIAGYFRVTLDYLLHTEGERFPIDLQKDVNLVIDRYALILDGKEITKEEWVESLAYLMTKRMMEGQNNDFGDSRENQPSLIKVHSE